MNSVITSIEYHVPEGEVLVSKTDMNGIISFCNSTFIEVSGFSGDELINSSHKLLRHPDMPQTAFTDLWKSIRSNKPWRGLIKNLRKDGSFYWVESNITPLIANGNAIGYVSFSYKATPEQTERAEEDYRNMSAGSARLRINEGKIVQAENRLMHWLNASSIKFRLVAFMSFLFSILVVIGIYNLHEASNTYDTNIASLEVVRMDAYALDTARLAELSFKEQMQTGQNILSIGRDSVAYDAYVKNFDAQGAQFRSQLGLLKNRVRQMGLPYSDADAAFKSYEQLTDNYRSVINDLSVHQSGRTPGGQIKDAELATIAHIEMIISRIQDEQQNHLSDFKLELDRSQKIEGERAIAILVAAALIGLFLSMRLVVSIMHPIGSASSSLKKIIKSQQHFLEIILRLEVYRDRVVEEQRIGNFIMSRMTDINSQLDSSLRRYTRPAENLSGDVLIAAFTPANTIHILLADAVGHGLVAAINVLPLCQTFYDLTHKGFAIDQIATDLNIMVKQFMPCDRFVSATLISIDRRTQLIEVWNGGIPAVQLINQNGQLLKRWDSQYLPLGILSEDRFSAKPDTYRYQEDGQLILFSDGLVEAMSPLGEQFGYKRISELFGCIHRDARFAALIDALDQHLQGQAAHDDISLAIVDISTGVDPAVLSCQLGRQKTGAVTNNGWRIALSLGAEELKYLDVVPLLTKITTRIHVTREHRSALFLMLTELFDSALNYGLLGLEPHIKLCTEGYERYLELRDTRLQTLCHGIIELEIRKVIIDDKPAVMIRVESGGSEYAQVNGLPVEVGIELTKTLAYKLECSDNEVIAYYVCN